MEDTAETDRQENTPDLSGIQSNFPEPGKPLLLNPINDQMKGLPLREFLRTPFYLTNKATMIFKNREDTEIIDFKPYITRPVLHIEMPDKTNIYTVIME